MTYPTEWFTKMTRTTETGSKHSIEEELVHDAMDTVETITGGNCVVELERELTAQCPYDGQRDEYKLTVRYRPKDHRCMELESFAEFLDMFVDIEASQEGITQFLAHFLLTHIGPEWVEVELDGEHYGIHTTTTKRREL